MATNAKDDKDKCPETVSTKVVNSAPKTEIRVIQYGKNCDKEGKFISSVKKSGSEACCVDPPPTVFDRLISGVPYFSELGKSAKGIFDGGYHFGLIKLNVKQKTHTGVEFIAGGVFTQETGAFTGSLDIKYLLKEHNISFLEKWSTDNTIASEVSVTDKILQGLNLVLKTSFSPEKAEQSGSLDVRLKRSFFAVETNVPFMKWPTVKGSIVIGALGWYGGIQGSLNTKEKTPEGITCALGFSTKDVILNTTVEHTDEGQIFGGSIYHKITHRLESAIDVSWKKGDDTKTNLAIGCKYDLDEDAIIRTKIDNKCLVGLSYQQKLREGISLTLSAQIDGLNINGGQHKVGLSLELEA